MKIIFYYLKRILILLKILSNPSLNTFPRMLGNELKTVKQVLISTKWNLNYGKNLPHHKLEEEFSKYVGTKYAVAVNTGGIAIQMVLRALGLKPGDEVLHQVDTCCANPYAIIAAGANPVFCDINTTNFMLSYDDVRKNITENVKAIMPIHIWGYVEEMNTALKITKENRLFCIEDCCLALGAKYNGKCVGSFGDAGIFSFGCLKPIQTGEGGMIVTNDEALTKELRTIRNWGDMQAEYGIRDQKTLSWNGRISEIVAAVALEQLHGYERFLDSYLESIDYFNRNCPKIPGFIPIIPDIQQRTSVFSQVIFHINPQELKMDKLSLMNKFTEKKISVWHANFELLTSLSFFKKELWKNWVLKGDIGKLEKNYKKNYSVANNVFHHYGMGISKEHFLTRASANHLLKSINQIFCSN